MGVWSVWFSTICCWSSDPAHGEWVVLNWLKRATIPRTWIFKKFRQYVWRSFIFFPSPLWSKPLCIFPCKRFIPCSFFLGKACFGRVGHFCWKSRLTQWSSLPWNLSNNFFFWGGCYVRFLTAYMKSQFCLNFVLVIQFLRVFHLRFGPLSLSLSGSHRPSASFSWALTLSMYCSCAVS